MYKYQMDQENRAKQFAPFELKGHKQQVENKTVEINNDLSVFDEKTQMAVPVNASFNSTGKVIPVFVMIQGIRIRIDHVVWTNTQQWGCQFRCEITLSDHVETIDLFYYKNAMIWTMGKK